jgi:two-component system, cell cycle sensor histidine kinase and response regulator CckA
MADGAVSDERHGHPRPRSLFPSTSPASSAAELVAALPGIIWEADGVTFYNTFVSPQARELTGHDPADWTAIPRFWEDHLHPADRDRTVAAVEEAMSGRRDITIDYRFRLADGSYRWFRDAIRIIDGADGHVRSVGVMLDVTAEHEAELALDMAREDADLLARAMEQAADGVLITGPGNHVIYCNPAFEIISGYRREDILGRDAEPLLAGDDGQTFSEVRTAVREGRAWAGDLRSRRRDGSVYQGLTSIVPVRDSVGRVTSTVTILHDVTRERELEARLAQAARLEAVGQLAAGVAHDFNNVLTAIVGHAALATASLPPGHPASEDVAQIEVSADRARKTVEQLLAFGRRALLKPEVVDVADLLGELEPMLARLIGEDVRLWIQAPDHPLVRVDAGQLQNAVVNLVVNARNAMPTGGTITLHVAIADDPAARAAADENGAPAPLTRAWAVIRVADTGTGIEPRVLPRIFEPFFTTEPFGRGTGMGLAMVDGFVKQSGGFVDVESYPGAGTTFTIYLPLVPGPSIVKEPLVPDQVAARQSRPASSTATVLLVEDEQSIRAVAERMLELQGHRVIVCRSGEEALALVGRHAGPIDVLLSDVVLDGISGPEVAVAIRRVRPGIGVVLMSGYTEAEVAERGPVPGAVFLAKPYNREGLIKAIADARRFRA